MTLAPVQFQFAARSALEAFSPQVVAVSNSCNLDSFESKIEFGAIGVEPLAQMSLLEIPFKFGSKPDSYVRDETYLQNRYTPPSKVDNQFVSTLAWMNVFTGPICCMYSHRMNKVPTAITAENIAREKLIGATRPFDFFDAGIVYICSDKAEHWSMAAELFLKSADLFAQAKLHCATAISFELFAEINEKLAKVSSGKTARSSLDDASFARSNAGKAWLASLSSSDAGRTAKLRTERGIFNAQFSENQNMNISLLRERAALHGPHKSAELANDLLRIVWRMTHLPEGEFSKDLFAQHVKHLGDVWYFSRKEGFRELSALFNTLGLPLEVPEHRPSEYLYVVQHKYAASGLGWRDRELTDEYVAKVIAKHPSSLDEAANELKMKAQALFHHIKFAPDDSPLAVFKGVFVHDVKAKKIVRRD